MEQSMTNLVKLDKMRVRSCVQIYYMLCAAFCCISTEEVRSLVRRWKDVGIAVYLVHYFLDDGGR
jgi:hypothetical protein